MNRYWESVAERLKSLGKTAINKAVPVAVNYAFNTVIVKACSIIEEKLKVFYARTIRNSLITLAINTCGILLLIFKPFGNTASKIASFAFFSLAFVFFCIRIILYIREYGKMTLEFSKSIFQKKSLSKGAEDFIFRQFPEIALVYAGIDIASEYIASLKEVPRLHETIKLLIRIFRKRIAVFLCILSAYTITVFWIIKPILISKYS